MAVGGQGNLLSARILGEAALLAGVPLRMSEIHGMAQRGGIVESALVFGEAKSSLISEGEADIMVGYEPLETLRALAKCNDRTTIITNTKPLPPFAAAVGKVPYPDLNEIKKNLKGKTGSLYAFNAVELALRAGSIMSVNMVMTGALAASNLLPVTADNIREAITANVRKNFVGMNLKAYEYGFSKYQEMIT